MKTISNTARNMGLGAMLWLGLATQSVFAAIPAAERTALQNLYAYTEGDHWEINANWNGPVGSECSWYGITCDAQGSTVIAIDMTGNNLVGTLPPLDALTHLQSINIRGNIANAPLGAIQGGGASGSVTAGGSDFIFGQIPELKSLTELQNVTLWPSSSMGGLTGPMPDLTGLTQLLSFDVRGNRLSGSVSSLQGLNKLVYLEVSYNMLSGNLPELDGLNQFQYLGASSNFFDGNIPALSGLNQLLDFSVSFNQLSGGVPDPSGLPQLIDFDVSGNLLDGSLPATIFNLPNLQSFNAGSNFLTGNVPTLNNVPQLQAFSVEYNQLNGTAPMPPANPGFQESLCPNPLTPASDPLSAVDTALNLVTGSTPWSLGCTQTPVAAGIRGTDYIDPATADGKTVTLKAWVYGLHPTGTVTFTMGSPYPTDDSITACDSVPLVDGIATCTVNGLTTPDGRSFISTGYDGSLTWTGFSASYSGDADNTPSISELSSQISYYQLQMANSSGPVQVGQSVDLIAGLTGFTPGGMVVGYYGVVGEDFLTFYEGDTVLCAHAPIHILASPQTPGAATNYAPQITAHCVTQFSTAGDHVITVKNDNLLAIGQPSAPMTQTVQPATDFYTDQFALTGSWYNSYTSGQGLEITVYPDMGGAGIGVLGGAWYTYDALGNEQWYTLQGQMPAAGASAYTLALYNTTGGHFNTTPVASAVPQGSATLTFHDCGHASLAYQFNDGRSGTIPETRISVPTNCMTAQGLPMPLTLNYTDALHSGAWYNPQTSGQGLFFDIIPAQSTIGAEWFTYAPQQEGQTGTASQRWFSLQGTYTPGNLAVKQVPIYAVIGGLFNAPTRTALLPVGSADITFTSCTAMTLTYTFTSGEYKGLTGTIHEQPVGPATQCQSSP